MTENKVPYLCGGVLFFLMAHMKPSSRSAREHQNGLKDDHSDVVVMQDLLRQVKTPLFIVSVKIMGR